MPASLKAALADPFALGDEAAHLWRPPAVLPTIADIASGISILEAQLQRVDRQHAAYCLAKMAVGFNERRSTDEAKLVLETWLEVAGDVPNDLWSSATMELLQTWSRDKHYGRMPEASDFRNVVSAQMTRRKTELARSRQMLQAASKAVEDSAEKPLETRLGRMEHTRSIYVRMKRMTDVQRIDREIAAETGQPVVTSAAEIPASTAAATERPAFVPDPRLAALAERHAPSPMRAVIVPKKPANTATQAPAPPPVSEDWSRYEVE